ncbi:hypothetical protein QJQ45_009244 [Haematococcus lacustris]|nr:hypothetical protein QJQ45_009244 [Haematococcus lacustris]
MTAPPNSRVVCRRPARTQGHAGTYPAIVLGYCRGLTQQHIAHHSALGLPGVRVGNGYRHHVLRHPGSVGAKGQAGVAEGMGRGGVVLRPVSLAAWSSHATRARLVVLKQASSCKGATALVNTTFSDKGKGSLPFGNATAPFTARYQPEQPLLQLTARSPQAQAQAGLPGVGSAYAGLGGAVGQWRLLINDTAPGAAGRELVLQRWALRLCGTRLPRVDALAAGGVAPSPAPLTAPNTTAPLNTSSASSEGGSGSDGQQQSAQGLGGAAWQDQYRRRVLAPLDQTLRWLTGNSSLLDQLPGTFSTSGSTATKAKERVLGSGLRAGIQQLRASLEALPQHLGITVDPGAEKRDFQAVLSRVATCYRDLTLCYQQAQDASVSLPMQASGKSFPIVQLDQAVSAAFKARTSASQARMTQVEVEIQQGLSGLADMFPNLASRVGVRDGANGSASSTAFTKTLQQALTSQLYGAAFASAAVAYFDAYLQAVLGFVLYTQRYQIALNPRVAVTNIVNILQGVLGATFFGLSNVPLFPSLAYGNGTLALPVLVNTATSATSAFRSSIDQLAQGLAQNANAAILRRGYVFNGVVEAMQSASDQFEAQLSQARAAMTQLGAVVMDLVNTTADTVDQVRALVDSLVPGPSLQQVLVAGRLRSQQAAQRALQDLQRVVPLGDVQQLVGIWNSTVDGLLAELQQGAAQLVGQVPGPAFRQSMSQLSSALSQAQSGLAQVQAAVEESWPGPLLNATFSLLRLRTQGVVSDISSVVEAAQHAFPALDPQALFRQLNATVDNWWQQVDYAMRSGSQLVASALPSPSPGQPPALDLAVQVAPLVASVSQALGRGAAQLQSRVQSGLAGLQVAAQPLQDSITGLQQLADSVNARLQQQQQELQGGGSPSGNSTEVQVQLLSDQVRSALATVVTEAPLPSALLSQINTGLERLQSSLLQQGQGGSGPLAAADSLVRATLAQVNSSTEPWRRAVQGIDQALKLLRPDLAPQFRSQLQSLRGRAVSGLANLTHRTSDLVLKWSAASGDILQTDVRQVFQDLQSLTSRAQQGATQLVSQLDSARERAVLQFRNSLPEQTVLEAVRQRLAQTVGVSVDQLQAGLMNLTAQGKGLPGARLATAVNMSSAVAKDALAALHARMQPVVQTLGPPGVSLGSGEGQVLPLIAMVNTSVSSALTRLASDWKSILTSLNDTSSSGGSGSSFADRLEEMLSSSRQRIAGQVTPLALLFSLPNAPTSQALPPRSTPSPSGAVASSKDVSEAPSLLAALANAAGQMSSSSTQLRASAASAAASQPLLRGVAVTTLAERLGSLRQRLTGRGSVGTKRGRDHSGLSTATEELAARDYYDNGKLSTEGGTAITSILWSAAR